MVPEEMQKSSLTIESEAFSRCFPVSVRNIRIIMFLALGRQRMGKSPSQKCIGCIVLSFTTVLYQIKYWKVDQMR
jgi:hypothetical protein